MRRAIGIFTALATALALTATVSVGAAPPPNPEVSARLASLEARVTALELEVDGLSGGSTTTTTAPTTTTTVAPTTTLPPSTTTTVAPTTTTTVAPTTTTTVAPTTTTTTTLPPTTTTTTTVPATGGVNIYPGNSVASIVNSHPAGTVFIFHPGTYSGVKLYPKNGQQFIGRDGAIFRGDGQNLAFSGDATGVVIDNLVIDGYSPAPQMGMIHVGAATGWTIRNSEFRNSAAVGLVANTGFQVIGNYLHHNAQLGLKAQGANILLEGNEIAYNNPNGAFDVNWEAGGGKFLVTTNLVVRNNHAHDNVGAGLWTDHNNTGTLYEGNLSENNTGPGIFHEISYSAVIRNNTIRNNGHGWYLGGILIANSQGVEVYGNTLVGNDGSVSLLHQSRGSGNQGVFETRNISVRDNHMTQSAGWTGLNKQTAGDTSGIVFDDNTYVLSGTQPFHWTSGRLSVSGWLALGQDANSGLE